MREKLINDITTDAWKKNLFSEEYLRYESLYEPEEKVRQAVILPYGGFHRAEDVEVYLKKILLSSVDEILEWFSQKEKRLLRIKFDMKENAGYVISERDGEKKESSQVVLAFRRDKNGLTKYGFYISAFNIV